jgi:precorrin-6B methylase 2
VFYDIGSGMGRIVCAAARKRLRKCTGVEMSEPLCQIARCNAMKLRGRKAPIEIVCGDAPTADLGEGTIYFMFDPFGADTIRDTLENIMKPECLMCSKDFWLLAKLLGQGQRRSPTGPGAGK